ncbi:hypothetical protein Back2_14730 [Nocardioides baekrokdamisoli]|uniref:Uncharacterized protein n=1 Tax=Nocardioides baekrokdamisoli TaxID=1804624 RepID=A0A3G9IFU2_9ACTN|nr:hypothetical protein [Nocardioides baekrokdamisoli]BBH17186.1 hypothetical protein Back2_14730 [Nocardioides baekrokdamisoli]
MTTIEHGTGERGSGDLVFIDEESGLTRMIDVRKIQGVRYWFHDGCFEGMVIEFGDCDGELDSFMCEGIHSIVEMTDAAWDEIHPIEVKG